MGSKVTVLGLGRMGAALARAFGEKGHKTIGWSRSEERRNAARTFCEPSATAGQAVKASPLIVVCLADYAACDAVFSTIPDEIWSGRTLVQLSSGGPADAATMCEWASRLGVDYLDGAIGTSPVRIGHPLTAIFVSGSADAYSRHADVLSALGGRVTFVGENVAAAATFDIAWLSMYYGLSVGMLNAAAISQSRGVSLQKFFDVMPSFMSEMTYVAAEYTAMIPQNQFSGDQATIDVHLAAVRHLAASVHADGLDKRFPDLLVSILEDAQRRGLGDLEIAAAIQVLRATP